jgi:hypothetical protein
MDRGISMESIVNFKEGDKPSEENGCFFCKEKAPFLFGIVDSRKTVHANTKEDKPFIMKSVALCKVHAEAFNSLISGEHDVSELITVMKTTSSRKNNINLRGDYG